MHLSYSRVCLGNVITCFLLFYYRLCESVLLAVMFTQRLRHGGALHPNDSEENMIHAETKKEGA
jgi:hypothetical protein